MSEGGVDGLLERLDDHEDAVVLEDRRGPPLHGFDHIRHSVVDERTDPAEHVGAPAAGLGDDGVDDGGRRCIAWNDEIRAFIQENDAKLKTKGDS